MHQNTFAAGAPPRTPLEELTALPRPQTEFGDEREGPGRKRRGGRGRGRREGKGRGQVEPLSKNPGCGPASHRCLSDFSSSLAFF